MAQRDLVDCSGLVNTLITMGKSWETLSKETGINRSSLSRMRHGINSPRAKLRKRIAAFLRVSEDTLFNVTPFPRKAKQPSPVVIRQGIQREGYCEIPLTRGKVAIVDSEDCERLTRHNWTAVCPHGIWYARRKTKRNKVVAYVYMHQEALMMPDTQTIDHRNRDGLDNRKDNLRTCTQSQNCCNRKTPNTNTSGFKGVVWDKQLNKWRAQIKRHRIGHVLGYFTNITDAAVAYNDAALQYHGEFARLNPIP